MPTIKHILTKYPPQLFKTSSTPKLDVDVLLSYAIKKPKEFLYTHPEYKPTKKQNDKFNALINRRLKNEPIAYITGEKEFYGLNFTVNKNTLIPRPETELMVEQAIQEIKKTKNQEIKYSPLSQRGVGGIFPTLRRSLAEQGDCGATASQEVGELVSPPAEGPPAGGWGRVSSQQIILLDIGTGSGCIPISILKNLPKNITDNIQTHAIDISQKALILAKKNARLHGVEKKIKFIKNDLLKFFLLPTRRSPQKKTVAESRRSPLTGDSCGADVGITANPPYRGGGENSPLTRGARGVLKNSPLSQRGVGGIFNSANIIITANLPYISNSAYKKLSPDIKKYEPKNALKAGDDGLKYYRQLFKQIQKINSREITPKKLPSRGGVGGGLNPPRGSLSAEDSREAQRRITLLIEIDFKTMCPKSKLEKTIKQYLPNSKIEIKKDLGGAERVVLTKISNRDIVSYSS